MSRKKSPASSQRVDTIISFFTTQKFVLLALIFLLPFYALLYKLYIPHTNSFGCFDECMNYGAGYFLLKHRQLYSQIFFNHQPIMAYLSAFIQWATHPQSLYALVLRHTQFLFLFSFIFNVMIIRRFRFAGLAFVIIYELSKYYLFGNRFLAEAYIVYPMVYVAGLCLYKLTNKPIRAADYILAGILTWFSIFNREPYIFAVAFSYIILLGRPRLRSQYTSLIIFLLLTILQLATLPLKDYWYSIWTVSYQGTLHTEVKTNSIFGAGVVHIFFYPFFLLFGGVWNEFRLILVGLSAVFITLSLALIYQRKYLILAFVYILLGLANIRYITTPGEIFYAAFHMLPWFGLFLFSICLFINMMWKPLPKFSAGLAFTVFIVFLIYLLQPKTFFRQHIDPQVEFITNYGQTYQIGEVVRILSKPDQTFYIDGNDGIDIAYIQSRRTSPYAYSWFQYFAVTLHPYTDARENMFKTTPPDFYFGYGPHESGFQMPLKLHSQYQLLTTNGKTSHIYVRKSIVGTITTSQWNDVKQFGIDSPDM